MDEKKLETLRKNELDKAIKRKENHDRLQREKYFGDSEGKFRVMEHLNFEQAKLRLINKLKDSSHLINNINLVRWHNSNESLKHFTAKAICSKVLMDNGHFLSSECLDADIYDIGMDYFIEVQDDCSPKKIDDKINKFRDVFIFPLKDIPNNIEEMYKYFKKKLLGE